MSDDSSVDGGRRAPGDGSPSPHFDLVVRGGTVLDPASGVRRRADIGVADGLVRAIDPDLPVGPTTDVVSASECLVVPGFVDAHTHVYWGGTPLGVDPDALAAESGVTTWIDTGSAGGGNLEGLVRHVIERSPLTIKAFVHLSYVGLVPVGLTETVFGELFDPRLGDERACLRAIEAFAPHVLGVKIRLGATTTGPNAPRALRSARAVADASGLPLMVHVADGPPPLEDALASLGRGDLLTHVFTPGTMGILDGAGRVRDDVWRARERGVLFDVGHGSLSFSFDVARRALEQGFAPDIISSDLHAFNVDGPVFDLPTTLTKFLALGVPLDDAIRLVTTAPGRLLGGARGGLALGGRADIAVVRLEQGSFTLGDGCGALLEHHERLTVVATVLAGKRLRFDPEARRQGKRKPERPVDGRLTPPGGAARGSPSGA
ncbi:MAG: amidohydrolase/deacetylase family metallohydrolase [Trueperaceae bacterium]|nr:amidohydrolase/deacetylase family metallohydrolase [Trueperaceae bacterium]